MDATQVQMHLPFMIPEYTDFSVAEAHLLNMGEIFTGVRAIPPAAKKFTIGYQGRASSVVVSGTPIRRPIGQFVDKTHPDKPVVCGPSRAMDYEFEIGAFVGKPLPTGQRIDAKDADEYIFGLVLLNDWTARDIQGFESNPVGPLCGKSFGTSISAWVVTLDALHPFRTPAAPVDPDVAPYFASSKRQVYDIHAHVHLLADASTSQT